MFDSIHGRLSTREPMRAVVEAGGVGYELHVPLSTGEALPAAGLDVRLLVHPVIRETEWRLYGFLRPEERQAFRALLRVNGVGPVMALGLLSGLEPAEFRHAVLHGDVRALTRVKGIGRKTAERILVELKDLVGKDETLGAPAAAPEPGGPHADAIEALVALGLDPTDARRRVEKVASTAPDLSVGDLVRAALRTT